MKAPTTDGAPPGGITIDNSGGVAQGTWPTSTSVSGFEGSEYQYHAAGSGADTFTWPLNATGTYEVYANWTAHANRASDAQYTIHHSGGSDSVSVNQQQNGGQWNLLGTFTLDAASSITLTDQANGYVVADAILLTPVGAPPNTATWAPTLPADGRYEVYAKWTAHANRASNAQYTVHHADGTTPVVVNQQQNGGQWNLLGTFNFTAGNTARVELTDQADGYVIADAVSFVPESAPPNSVTWSPGLAAGGEYEVYAKWTAHANRATNAQYTVHHAAGDSTVTVNQRQNGGQWNLLGTFTLDAASSITLTDQADGYVIADAIRLVGSTQGPTGSGIFYIYTDHLGTPQQLTDESGTVVWSAQYEPFGEAAVNEDPDGDGNPMVFNLRFPGQYYDEETGLHYNYFRDYDPGTGRYLTADPLGIIRNPMALVIPGAGYLIEPLNHLYVYVDGNPIGSFDSLGLARVKVYEIRSGVQMFWWADLFKDNSGPSSHFHERNRITWTAEASANCVFSGTSTEIVNGPTQLFGTHIEWWQATHTTWEYTSSGSGCPCKLTDYKVENKDIYFPHPGDKSLD